MSPAVLLPTIPEFQTAVVARGPGKLAIQHDAPVPSLSPDMVLVKTAAVAINPVDAKILDYSATAGAINGYDFSGTIVALGKDALRSGRLAVGDRVAGLVHGMNKRQPDVGAFAEYVGACGDILLKIPDNMSFEDAATLGVGIATSAMGLWGELHIPVTVAELREAAKRPVRDAGKPAGAFVLVAGGSTASGTRAIQLLKLAGLRPIATCSPKNFDLALSFGAEKVFDYQSDTCAADIRAYTSGQLAYAFDCVSLAGTTELCYKSIGRAGGRYVALEPFRDNVANTRPTIEPSWIMTPTIFGKEVALEGAYGRKAIPHHRRLGADVFAACQELLDHGLIDTHPTSVISRGWEGVVDAVNIIRNEPQSGVKLVCSVS